MCHLAAAQSLFDQHSRDVADRPEWIKRRDVVVGARRIISKKLREDWYRERHGRGLEEK